MRILLLAHAFNSLTQRLWAELQARGHTLSIEFDIADAVTEEAVALFRPELVVAPYLRRAIPEPVWRGVRCLVVHPGIVGDRGPSALDWALQEGEARWGVTVLQAEAEMDAGPVWASVEFPLRPAKKSSIYRNEVSAAALQAVLLAIERIEGAATVERLQSRLPVERIEGCPYVPPRPEHVPGARGRLRPLMRQADRALDWTRDSTEAILRHIRAADGFPGVADRLFGEPCHLYDAWPEARLRGTPGEVIARRETALLRATVDGAVWIGHVKRAESIKLPAALSFPEQSAAVPEAPPAGWWRATEPTWQDIAYEEQGAVGVLHFEFYNGAMSSAQCERLRSALQWARARPVRVLVLAGGQDFWSNGIHLNAIEAESLQGGSAADASWRNIQAMDDLALELITTEGQLTIAALAGNAGAGGCFLARAADLVWAREAVLLNPHYRNMGNLYGSEYWSYLLPKRLGAEAAQAVMRNRQPLTARAALANGLIDDCLAGDAAAFGAEVARRAAGIAADPAFAQRLADKRAARAADEAAKPLAAYRAEELAQMRRNFYGFDPSYHVARHHFVHKSPASWTPRHLARHRELAGRPA